MNKVFIGIDYSMNSPGVAVICGDSVFLYGFYNGYKGPNQKVYQLKNGKTLHLNIYSNVEIFKTQIERFDILARKVLYALNKTDLDNPVVYIEGYSMGSKGQVFNIAENTAILKHYLYRCGMEAKEVAPMTIKKFASGSGKALKEDMHDAFVKETGLDLKDLLTPHRKLGSPVTDLVDSFWIAKYAEKETQERNERSEKHQTEVV